MEKEVDIFVRNIAKDVEEGELLEIFEPFGEVSSVTLVTDKETGRKVGFGFVGMPAKDEALSAINGLKGTSLKGQVLEFQNSRTRFERRQAPDRRGLSRETPDRRLGDRRLV